jgi:hypothetical protein
VHNKGIAKKDISPSIGIIRVCTSPSVKPWDRFQKSKMILFFYKPSGLRFLGMGQGVMADWRLKAINVHKLPV